MVWVKYIALNYITRRFFLLLDERILILDEEPNQALFHHYFRYQYALSGFPS